MNLTIKKSVTPHLECITTLLRFYKKVTKAEVKNSHKREGNYH